MSPASAPRPFTFDTVFDGDRVIAPVRPKAVVYTAEDLEAARAAGYASGRADAVARAEADAAAALAEATAAIRAALAALTALAHDHRTASAELALTAARKIAGAALDQFPEQPALAALDALARELESRPRLIVRAAPAGAERLEAVLSQAAEHAGFAGQLAVKADPALPRAAFVFDWGEGRAAYDPDKAADMVQQALDRALAAEGLHAEPLLLDAGESR